MIELKNIKIKYVKEFYTLFNVNADFSTNTLIVGDINSGAYSILRIISKIDKNYEGKVLIDGVDLKQIKDKNLDIAYIPHAPILFNHKSIEKNLAYPLKIRKYSKTDVKNIVQTYKNKYLANFPSKIAKMNNSEKKIVTLVRAVIRRPKYLLVEDFFSDLAEKYFPVVEKIFNALSPQTTIIACENEDKNLKVYEGFFRIKLSYGSLKTDS